MTGPRHHERVADALRGTPPPLDDLRRVRMEQSLIRVAGGTGSIRRGRVRWVGAGITLAAAAAAVAFFVWNRDPVAVPDSPASVVARFEVRPIESSAQRGTLEAGSVLRTRAEEVGAITVGDSEVELSPNTRLRIVELDPGQLGLELTSGEIRVGFHPRERGREHMTVETPAARVEVVGTVFTVRVEGEATRVSVSEGQVRVIRRSSGEERPVGRGESWLVDGTGVAPAEQPVEEQGVEETPSVAPPVDPTTTPMHGTAVDPTSEEPPVPSPAEELARARALVERGRVDEAEPILARLGRPGIPGRTRAEAWTLLADLRQHRGDNQGAVAAYEAAAATGAGSLVGANAIYARAHLEDRRLHDAEAARRSYHRYLETAPDGPLASQARSALCRLGDVASCPEER